MLVPVVVLLVVLVLVVLVLVVLVLVVAAAVVEVLVLERRNMMFHDGHVDQRVEYRHTSTSSAGRRHQPPAVHSQHSWPDQRVLQVSGLGLVL